MRDIFKKTTAVAMVAAAALAVSACGKTETTNVSENVSTTDMNAEGSMNDMSASDMNASMGANDMGATNSMGADNAAMMGTDNGTNAQ